MNKKIFEVSILKSLIFNLRYFGLSGIKLPILVSKRVVLAKLGGQVIIQNASFGCIHIGFPSVGIFDYKNDRTIWENDGNVFFDTKATLGQGVKISNFGKLQFGKGVRIMANSSIICRKTISFGNDDLISWNCRFMDTDFHKILDENGWTNEDDCIAIGDNVWICSECVVLKGVNLESNNVVACGSLISRKNIRHKNCIVGNNGKIIRENITWKP